MLRICKKWGTFEEGMQDYFEGMATILSGAEAAEGLYALGRYGFTKLVARQTAKEVGEAAVSNGRVFWSGGNVAKTSAAQFAKANGMKTLEMTTKGRIMNALSPYLPGRVSTPIWNNLSRNFAKGAVNEVNFFTIPGGPRATSIWLTVERPILEHSGVNIITHTIGL